MSNISWGTIQSLVIFFAPVLLPKAIAYYRSVVAAPRTNDQPIRPLPTRAFCSLVVLVAIAGFWLVQIHPYFVPENVFTKTQSRLQIPVDVLFTRLASLRPDGALTTQDEVLRAKFVNLESRLLYLQFGPDVMTSCLFGSPDSPRSYLLYALPDIMLPHLLNLITFAFATSPFLVGRTNKMWRMSATMAALVIVTLDVYLVCTYNHQLNSRALRLAEISPFFWTTRARRLAALGLLDLVVAGLIFLASTRRAFIAASKPAARVDSALRTLITAKSKISAASLVKNTVVHDNDLREIAAAYWRQEARLMQDMMADAEVMKAVENATAAGSKKVDLEAVTLEAEKFAEKILEPLVRPAPPLVVS